MPTGWAIAASIVIGYLIGSVPFGVVIPRQRGIDIMQTGTKNPGAANVYRRVGRMLGVVVGLCDGAKGAVAVAIAHWGFGLNPGFSIAAGAAAVLGHWHSVFLRFKGGAGLATAVGVAFVLFPIEGIVGVSLTLVLMKFTKNTGRSALVGYAAALVAGVLLHHSVLSLLCAIGVGVVVSARALIRDYRAAKRARGSA
jgi:glycerol-3-phosphate acyltransferase PlsY